MSFIHDIPEFEDKFIGYAILALMGYFLFVWLTSASSPLPQFANKSQIATMVAHLELLMVALIPLTLMALIQSLNPRTRSSNRASQAASRLSVRLESYRKTRSQTYKQPKKTVNKDENLDK